MDAPQIPPTYPFHVARAYGLPQRARQGVAPVSAVPVANRRDRVEIRASGLVAASVAGSVDFGGAAPPAAPGAIAFYRHPADRNAAATGVELGRAVDLDA